MTDPLLALEQAVAAVRFAWFDGGQLHPAVGLGRPQLVAVNDALGALRRQVDAAHAQVAAEIARESRPELGSESLAKEQGYRNPATLIAATTGTSTGEAAQLIAVGEATASRMTLTGDARPAKYPHVAAALAAGRINAKASGAIICMLDRVALRASRDALEAAERTLSEQAPGLVLDQLAKLIARAEAYLDPDGLEPKEADRRAARTLSMFERDGMLHIAGRLDIESGAPIKTAVDAIVTAEFRRDEPAGSDVEERTLG